MDLLTYSRVSGSPDKFEVFCEGRPVCTLKQVKRNKACIGTPAGWYVMADPLLGPFSTDSWIPSLPSW